jgi:hypothetical protein
VHMTKRLTLLGPLGRIKCTLAEDKWECPGIPTVNSIDNVDNNVWSFGVEAYA